MVQIIALLASLALISPVFSHPGGHPPRTPEQHEALHASKRSLADCASTLKGRDLANRAVSRREEIANRLREKRGLKKKRYLQARDFYDDLLAKNHESNRTDITSPDVDPSLLFSGNTSCILQAEVTEGPYFVEGEYVRQDIREDQAGTDLFLDLQVIDVNTCEPVPEVYVEIWHCNATGVYSGVVANGNGDMNDSSNLDATWLRGLWATDEEGVAQFQTIFPGHYTGRSSHIHLLAHQDGTEHANGTFSGGTVSHVGQFFFDEALRAQVEAVEPYISNQQPLTTNDVDWIARQSAANDFDPFIEYVYLGEDPSDGIFGWLSIGVDTNNAFTPHPAVILTEDGGVENDDGGMIGGIPSGGFPSGFPSGFPIPSGFPGAGGSSSGLPPAAGVPSVTPGTGDVPSAVPTAVPEVGGAPSGLPEAEIPTAIPEVGGAPSGLPEAEIPSALPTGEVIPSALPEADVPSVVPSAGGIPSGLPEAEAPSALPTVGDAPTAVPEASGAPAAESSAPPAFPWPFGGGFPGHPGGGPHGHRGFGRHMRA